DVGLVGMRIEFPADGRFHRFGRLQRRRLRRSRRHRRSLRCGESGRGGRRRNRGRLWQWSWLCRLADHDEFPLARGECVRDQGAHDRRGDQRSGFNEVAFPVHRRCDGSGAPNVTMKAVRAGRIAALCAVILIAASSFEPFYLRIFAMNRQQYAAMLTELPYRKLPGLRRFLSDIRARTNNGDAVALYAAGLHHAPGWGGGYDYLRERAMYPLAGRKVISLVDDNDQLRLERLRDATCIASYRSLPAVDGFALAWRGPDGCLLRRVH